MRISVFLMLFFCLGFFDCFAQQQTNADYSVDSTSKLQFPEASQFADSKLSYKIIPAANNTYCYDIFVDERLMIHQPSIPSIPGNKGFKTQKQAEKVAKLVIEKIKRGEMPPSVTREELQKLKVL